MGASGSAVRMGSAFVELFADSSKLTAGLKNAQKSFEAWGSGIKNTGIGVTAVGSAIGVPMFAALKSFANAGSVLNDMSARTGEGVEALSLLTFAAQQTGTDMGVVESGAKKLDTTLVAAVNGSKEAAKGFADIGLNANDLIKMPLNEKLLAIGGALDKIENPSIRGATAVALLGKSGRSLIPMLAELGPLMERASKLRLGWTPEEAALADATGDRFDELTATFFRTAQAVGSKLAPAFLGMTDIIVDVVGPVRDWIDENPQLITGIAAAAAATVGLGTALIGVGYTVTYAGAAIGALGPALALIPSISTLAIGGMVYWAASTETARTAVTALSESIPGLGTAAQWAADTASEAWGVVVSDAQETGTQVVTAWGGITDAISSGDLGLAAEIAMAGLNAAWLTATQSIRDGWVVVSTEVMSLWQTAMTGMEMIGAGFAAYYQSLWIDIKGFVFDAINAISSKWDSASGWLADRIIDVGVATGVISGDAEDIKGARKEDTARRQGERDQAGTSSAADRAKRKSEIAQTLDEQIGGIATEGAKKQGDLVDAENAALIANEKAKTDAQDKLAALRDKAGDKAADADAKRKEDAIKEKRDKDSEDKKTTVGSAAGSATFSGLASSMNRDFVPDFSTVKTPAEAIAATTSAATSTADAADETDMLLGDIRDVLRTLDSRVAQGGVLTA